jgi:predicted AAA+ superfamily ATPase
LDEIQDVTGWKKAINSFLVDFDCDIYLTASNSRLLSSELSTFLAGRYVQIHVWPVSFRELLKFGQALKGTITEDTKIMFEAFLRLGGFPVIHGKLVLGSDPFTGPSSE